ncbi:MAG: electron transfer flavoprotein subunit beta/FixA family protein, partial [Thermoplasmata archaeon]
MKIALLLKSVGNLEEARFDPDRKTMVRDGPMFPNPFDARALGAALALRGVGGSVTVLSMGPPGADGVLAETLRAGADRAIRIGDPSLAGSDVLLTARVLAGALRELDADLVLAGRASTDSETGVVGPEVAALLDRPMVGPARSIRGPFADSSLEVEVDEEHGRARYRLFPPVLLTVGEKIGKPAKPRSEAGVDSRPELWDLA